MAKPNYTVSDVQEAHYRKFKELILVDFPHVIKTNGSREEICSAAKEIFGSSARWIGIRGDAVKYAFPDGLWVWFADPFDQSDVFLCFREATPEVIEFKLKYG